MKQRIVLIGIVFAMLTAYSQNDNSATTTATISPADTAQVDSAKAKDYCPHRIWVNFGMAYSNDIYKRFDNIQQKYAFGNVLEVGYSYFFHPNMGVGLGVGVSKISAKALLGNGGSITVQEPGYDPLDPNATYEMFFGCERFAEKQSVWAIEVPLTFQFEMKLGEAKRNGIFADLGVRGYFPISGRTNFVGGEVALSGREEGINVVWPTELWPHFGVAEIGEKYAKAKYRPSVDILGEFGGIFGLTKSTDLYLGVYATYGFLDILPKEKVHYVEKDGNNIPYVNGLANSDAFEDYNKAADNSISEKWNLFQVGLKVGLRFKTCSQRSQSFREDKRDFLDKYEDRLNNAAKGGKKKGDDEGKKGKKGGEAVYIIPIYIGGNGDDGDGKKADLSGINTDGMDKDVIDLIKALTDAQIYFDLDKDVPKSPKIAQQETDRAVEILKNNPNIKVTLSGYTCRLGTEPHNQDLAQRRANRIKNMLIDKGVDPKQLGTEAFTVEDYPKGMFSSLEEARTVIFKIEVIK